MSLVIDVDQVTEVLLAGGWLAVTDKSFTVDAYEYLWWPNERSRETGDPTLLHGGGNSGVCATGFSFKTSDGQIVSGPLTTILAVKTRPSDAKRV